MRVLLTGANGHIGRHLRAGLGKDFEVISTRRGRVDGRGWVRADLAEPAAADRLVGEIRPDVVVHTAAMAAPEDCERDPAAARRINVQAPADLARACRRAGARLIHFSTDLVFGGKRSFYTEADPTDPVNVYGRLKAEAERLVLEADPSAVALRVALVYGWAAGGRPSFLDWLHGRMSRGERAPLFADQWRTPTPTASIAEMVGRLLRRPELAGVFHWSGADRVSRVEFGSAFCRVFGFPESLIAPCRMADLPGAPRPADCSLDCSRLARLLDLRPVGLEEGLLQARAARG